MSLKIEIKLVGMICEDEVDLVALFETLWAGRWKMPISIVVAALLAQLLQFLRPSPIFLQTPKLN